MLPEPTKTEYQLLTAAATRHGRRKHGISTCEGVRCVAELLARHPAWIRLIVLSQSFVDKPDTGGILTDMRTNALRLVVLPDAAFKKIAQTATPQGILALFHPDQLSPESPLPPVALVLDRIAEPGNMGTILRTAWAVGLTRVWLTTGCVDPFAPKTIRAGMGAQFALTLSAGGDLATLQAELMENGYRKMWLSKPTGGISCCSPEFDMAGTAVVIGNEANGVTDIASAPSVSIPMPGKAESLNASQAATILLYEAVRRGVLS